MRIFSLAIMLMFVIYTPHLPAPPHYRMRMAKDELVNGEQRQVQTSFELVMDIVRQRYCKSSDPAGADTLRMKLRLRYRNIGDRPLILYNGDSVVYREMISLNAQDAQRGHYLFDASLFVDTTTASPVPDK